MFNQKKARFSEIFKIVYIHSHSSDLVEIHSIYISLAESLVMKLNAVFLFFLLLGTFSCSKQQPETQLFLVRHAEKDTLFHGDNPSLTEAGHQRAQRLKTILFNKGIEQIYSTAFTRTNSTVAPLQESLELPLLLYDYHAFEHCLDEIRASGKTTLMCGHSDNLLPIITYLNGLPPVSRIENTDYHYIFKLRILGDTTLVELMHF